MSAAEKDAIGVRYIVNRLRRGTGKHPMAVGLISFEPRERAKQPTIGRATLAVIRLSARTP